MIQLAMIIIARLAEALTIYAFVTMFMLLGKIERQTAPLFPGPGAAHRDGRRGARTAGMESS